MAKHPDELVVEELYAALAAGDPERLRNVLDPDVTWHQVGFGVLAGHYHGPDEVLSMFAKLAAETGSTATVRLELTATDGEGTVGAEFVASASRGGESVSRASIAVYRVADGRIVDANTLSSDLALAHQFFE
jgi:ketosteroid isomerase-like protein